MKVGLTYDKTCEVGPWAVALWKPRFRWPHVLPSAEGPRLWLPQSTHCWSPTVLPVSFVHAAIACGLLATVSETSGSVGGIELDFNKWFWENGCMAQVETTGGDIFLCLGARVGNFHFRPCGGVKGTGRQTDRQTDPPPPHTHASTLYVLNVKPNWIFVITLKFEEYM